MNRELVTDWQLGAAANGRPIIFVGWRDFRPGLLGLYEDRLGPTETIRVTAVHYYPVERLPERTQAFLFAGIQNLTLDTTVTVIEHTGLLPPCTCGGIRDGD